MLSGIQAGCRQPNESEDASGQLATQFYEILKTGNFNQIKPLLDSTGKADLENWQNLLKAKQQNLGNLKSYRKTDQKFHELGSLKEYLLKYRVVYEKDSTFEIVGTAFLYGKTAITQYQYGTEEELASKWKNF